MTATEEVPQITGTQLAAMAPQAIEDARMAGQLAALMGSPIPVRLLDNVEQVTADEVPRLTPEQITQARDAGRLTGILTDTSGAG